MNPSQQPSAEPGLTPYLSEEEEDLLALNLSGHISDQELAELREQLHMPQLEPDS